jgi:DNA polymerase
MNYFIPTAKITRDQGKIFRMNGRLLMPLFHPAAALRSTGTLKLLTLSFKKLPKVLEKYEELVTTKTSKSEKNESLI